MKVLVVSGEYPPMKGGVGRYSFNLVHALAKKPDVEVSVAIGANSPLTSNPNQDIKNIATTTTATTYRGIIRKGDKRNSDRILQIVSEIKPDIVNIQYERGLYEVDTTIRHTFWRLVHGSTLDRFYKMCPVPTVSTLHTVFPQEEYSAYIKERALRKEGRFGFLPQPLRAAIRKWVMKQRYDLLLQVVNQSDGVISPARTLQEVVRRGTVIYHGAEPAIELPSTSSSLMNDKREHFRKTFGLPVDKKLLLAFGYAGSYKGFDLLGSLNLPNGWSLVIKQTKHERGFERPIEVGKKNNLDNVIISLNLGYLDETAMSKLFFACDAIIFPYKIVSISGVMFDALAHGLPFVASDLRFFKEFADMGLGIVCKRTTQSFERAISTLALEYDKYKTTVEQFRSKLRWSNIANEYIEFFSDLISQYKQKQ
ncbi:MAG: glycosyltransferase [Thermoproteota archaeon]|nr:glycosyltransferase [Thermoproteota archaeon]